MRCWGVMGWQRGAVAGAQSRAAGWSYTWWVLYRRTVTASGLLKVLLPL